MSDQEYLIKKEHRLRPSVLSSSAAQYENLPPEAIHASHATDPPLHTLLRIYDSDQDLSVIDQDLSVIDQDLSVIDQDLSMIVHVPESRDGSIISDGHLDDTSSLYSESLTSSMEPQAPEYLDPNTLDMQEPSIQTWPRQRVKPYPRKSSLPAKLETEFTESVLSLHSQELPYSNNGSLDDVQYAGYSEWKEWKYKCRQVVFYLVFFVMLLALFCYYIIPMFGKPPFKSPAMPKEQSNVTALSVTTQNVFE